MGTMNSKTKITDSKLTCHIDAFLWVFLKVELRLGIFAQQITDLLIVDLQVGRMDQKLAAVCHAHCLKDVVKCSETMRTETGQVKHYGLTEPSA